MCLDDFIITSLSVLQVQEGFTEPFILKNTLILPVLKGLGKILVIQLLDMTFEAKNPFTIIPTLPVGARSDPFFLERDAYGQN